MRKRDRVDSVSRSVILAMKNQNCNRQCQYDGPADCNEARVDAMPVDKAERVHFFRFDFPRCPYLVGGTLTTEVGTVIVRLATTLEPFANAPLEKFLIRAMVINASG